ncbi:hypothetical protein HO173_006471 [Letharia columbiana]|uniref:Uncharacterized protein n=1 Tax=Letharia columbiana TaxID=112416 RepID=A0A8H6L4H5_9LECA|nr:uncharacterized protein HO173_006471 [Letharia columbiana]KAF6235277.1 hypothetical protein HO173_006471 [Letharia columbiana]
MEKISFTTVTKPYAGWKFYDETSSEGSHDYGKKGPSGPEDVLQTELTATMSQVDALDQTDPAGREQLTPEHASIKERLSSVKLDDPNSLEKIEACHSILKIIMQRAAASRVSA